MQTGVVFSFWDPENFEQQPMGIAPLQKAAIQIVFLLNTVSG